MLSPSSDINPCHSLFFDRDHLRSNMGIISGPGSFAVQFGDHLRSGIIYGPGIICGPVQYLYVEPVSVPLHFLAPLSVFASVSVLCLPLC